MKTDKIIVAIINYHTEMFDGSRHFLMPKYQRPFSREEKHIEDFGNDMVFAIEEAGDLPYLMGSIYIAKVGYDQLGEYVNQDILRHERLAPLANGSDFYFVIDGQQRTITFFLFLLAFKDTDILSHILNSAIPKVIPGKMGYEYFLHLGSGTEIPPQTKSNRRIKETYEYFRHRLADFPRRDDLKRFAQQNLQVVQLFSILGLSVFSKALLLEIHKNTLPQTISILSPGKRISKMGEMATINLFEEIGRIKGANTKLVAYLHFTNSHRRFKGGKVFHAQL